VAALLRANLRDSGSVAQARELLQSAGDEAPTLLLRQALSSKDPEALDHAEAVLGRRTLDLLPPLSGSAQWFQAARLARKLADHGSRRAMEAVGSMVASTDEQTRREVAKGLGGSVNPAALLPLSSLLEDPSPQVAIVAARSLAGSGLTGAAQSIAARLDALDIDNKDFALAKEMILALGKSQERAAGDALASLAGRRALIKRGHFQEIQELARQTLADMGGGRR
jgi:HEAT repeat protein